jgi:hypothetical protein
MSLLVADSSGVHRVDEHTVKGSQITEGDFKNLNTKTKDVRRWFKAPAGLRGIRSGEKLYVLESGLTPSSCKVGEGLEYHKLSKNVMIVKVGSDFAWMQ